MTWVKTFEEQEATGKLAEVYDQVRKDPLSRGRVPNVIKAIGLRPDALLQVWRSNMAITFGASTLGRAREEMIATAVSAVNRCHY